VQHSQSLIFFDWSHSPFVYVIAKAKPCCLPYLDYNTCNNNREGTSKKFYFDPEDLPEGVDQTKLRIAANDFPFAFSRITAPLNVVGSSSPSSR
jgi:hypothetical protein